jgi:serine/threonine protein kinase/WD40 repeat protein
LIPSHLIDYDHGILVRGSTPALPTPRPNGSSMIGRTISHYRITAELGSGGMGTVYRADDLKLDRTVALKFLAPEFLRDPDAKSRFVHEAKAASALDHPNICTIHGIEETTDGRLFIAMACYEGETVKDRIARGALPIEDAIEITVQVAEGLAKAHGLGIVHRDIKPANVMVTEDGLVKLLDFGIAKLAGATQVTQTGAVLGTMPYMSPEQLQGEAVDRRSDVWSLGVVLYEMLTGTLPFTGEVPQAVAYGIVHADPKPLADQRGDVPSEVARTVATCLRKNPAERYNGAGELLLQLQPIAGTRRTTLAADRTVSMRELTDAQHRRPYPGLASFTADDAEFFHGRESQVESLWQKLRRSRMLALVGPSGVGKTSFLQAGLLPARPRGWGVLCSTPGSSPLAALRSALAPELTDDRKALQFLVREHDVEATLEGMRRWRRQHDEALLVIDQFEELFTLNPDEEQARFAGLLSRLVFEADVHVVISLRDDFLYRCHEYAALAPTFESLTVLGPLTGGTLRRALQTPARDCGYHFEDTALLDEMIAAVEGERGALPLMAFTVARLWEHRDQERGLLTREAYRQIGEVDGALAQHAEVMMDQIGAECEPLVREIFRNLVTAQGTRAVLDREQLLSVFPHDERTAAAEVIAELIAARLLTSFETRGDDDRDHHRIEIVHESLLDAWPRLVRWRTQDADGAQLRDQLRQAAQLWEQKGKTDDLLWTGTAYQEFALWRERYPGGLSDREDAFARAMAARSRRQRRRRRTAVAGAFVVLLAVLGVVGMFWQRSERTSRLSEAQRLRMLAAEALETDNTVALALATSILERADDPEVRRLALAALWKAPPRFVMTLPETLPIGQPAAALSPDARWLATAGRQGTWLWPAHGGPPRLIRCPVTPVRYQSWLNCFDASGQYLMTVDKPADAADLQLPWLCTFRSVSDGHVLAAHEIDRRIYGGLRTKFAAAGPALVVGSRSAPGEQWRWRRYSPDRDQPVMLRQASRGRDWYAQHDIDPSGQILIYAEGSDLFQIPLDGLPDAEPALVGRHPYPIFEVTVDKQGKTVASADMGGELRVWSLDRKTGPLYRYRDERTTFRVGSFDGSGRYLGIGSVRSRKWCVFDLERPGAEPLVIWPSSASNAVQRPELSTEGDWLVWPLLEETEVWFFPLTGPLPGVWRVIPDSTLATGPRERGASSPLIILPDGDALITYRGEYRGKPGGLAVCDLMAVAATCRPLGDFSWTNNTMGLGVDTDASGRYVVVSAGDLSRATLFDRKTGLRQTLQSNEFNAHAVAISADGRLVACGGEVYQGERSRAIIKLLDRTTGDIRELDPRHAETIHELFFLTGHRLLSSSNAGLRLWNLHSDEFEFLSDQVEKWPWGQAGPARGALGDGDRYLVLDTPGGIHLWDLDQRTGRRLPIPSAGTLSLAISPDGRFIVAGRTDGEVLVLPREADTPHVLMGHDQPVRCLWISPESDEIRSVDRHGKLCVWQVPRGKPLLARSHREFMAILRAQTNMRAVPDVDAADGYRITYDPFPGWAELPPGW